MSDDLTSAQKPAARKAFPGLVASFFTLSGGSFVEPPRNSFIERCEAAAAAGFTGMGLHFDDLRRTISAGVDVIEMRAVLRNNGLVLVEIEFLGGWALSGSRNEGISPALASIEAVSDALGGRHVSAGEFSGDAFLDSEQARANAAKALRANADRLASRELLWPLSPSRGQLWPTLTLRLTCSTALERRMRAC